MTDPETIAALRSELAKMQNHQVMILEANKRLAALVADQSAMLRDAENETLRILIKETKPCRE